LAELKKARPRDEQAIREAEAKVAGRSREARELVGKAREIEDAVYDLKAVNPHRKPDVDERTPEELLDIIEARGRDVAAALAVLRGEFAVVGSSPRSTPDSHRGYPWRHGAEERIDGH